MMYIVNYKNKDYKFDDYLEAIMFHRNNSGSVLRSKNEKIRAN